ncbi:hypothetical protein DRP04_03390 [Archaeoglobales archaeon]|nr:MAG: hypothetical protein DRP04_03390 [Archaeoglobales archaeon]
MVLEEKIEKISNPNAKWAIKKAIEYLQKYKQGVRKIAGVSTLVWARARYRDYTVFGGGAGISWNELVQAVGLGEEIAKKGTEQAVKYWKKIGGPSGAEPYKKEEKQKRIKVETPHGVEYVKPEVIEQAAAKGHLFAGKKAGLIVAPNLSAAQSVELKFWKQERQEQIQKKQEQQKREQGKKKNLDYFALNFEARKPLPSLNFEVRKPIPPTPTREVGEKVKKAIQEYSWEEFKKRREEFLRKQQEQAKLFNLGFLEPYARRYESAVEGVTKYAKAEEHPYPRFAAGFSESLLLLPTGILRLGAGLIRNPVKTIRTVGESIYEGLRKEPAYTAGQITGMLVAPEIARFGIGKAGEVVRFAGKTKIPAEELIPAEVIAGKQRFPMHRGTAGKLFAKYSTKTSKGVKKQVKEQLGVSDYLGFHATPMAGGLRGLAKGFEVTTEAKRPTDVPGLHMAARISPHFLRFGEGYKIGFPGRSLVEAIKNIGKKRGVLAVSFEEVGRLPREVREGIKQLTPEEIRKLHTPRARENIQTAREFLIEKAERGKAYTTWKAEVSLVKGVPFEEEVVLSPKTKVQPLEQTNLLRRIIGRDFEYYTEWRGRKVPIYRVKALREEPLREGVKVAERTLKKRRTSKTLEEYLYEFRKPKPETFEIWPNYPYRPPISSYISPRVSAPSSIVVPPSSRPKPAPSSEIIPPSRIPPSSTIPPSSPVVPSSPPVIPPSSPVVPPSKPIVPSSITVPSSSVEVSPSSPVIIPRSFYTSPRINMLVLGGRGRSRKPAAIQIPWKYKRLFNVYGDILGGKPLRIEIKPVKIKL